MVQPPGDLKLQFGMFLSFSTQSNRLIAGPLPLVACFMTWLLVMRSGLRSIFALPFRQERDPASPSKQKIRLKADEPSDQCCSWRIATERKTTVKLAKITA